MAKKYKGKYIILDGADGCGKTTQTKLLGEWLSAQHIDHVMTKEPGGTDIGMELKQLLQFAKPPLSVWEQFLLFEADRHRHFMHVIIPALQSGKVVISDRGFSSTIAYQFYAQNLRPRDLAEQINLRSCASIVPDAVIILDVKSSEALKRLGERNIFVDNFERSATLQKKVRDGFLQEARKQRNWFVIDAHPGSQEVHAAILALFQQKHILGR